MCCSTDSATFSHSEPEAALAVCFFLAETNAFIFADVLQLFPPSLHNA